MFGGEERFWLGPEGGQFALYFKPGDKFEFSNWKTPSVIDNEAYRLVERTMASASFEHRARLVNYSGTVFEIGIKRTVKLLDKVLVENILNEEFAEGVLFMKGDGIYRSKIGINALRSLGVAGSYDAKDRVLTVVTYNVQDAPNGYVNSMWEHQKEPYSGDVINAYNDGAPSPGKKPMGPFYEIESSSPAAALTPGELMQHVQRTIHLHGTEEELNPTALRLLGVSFEEIKAGLED